MVVSEDKSLNCILLKVCKHNGFLFISTYEHTTSTYRIFDGQG